VSSLDSEVVSWFGSVQIFFTFNCHQTVRGECLREIFSPHLINSQWGIAWVCDTVSNSVCTFATCRLQLSSSSIPEREKKLCLNYVLVFHKTMHRSGRNGVEQSNGGILCLHPSLYLLVSWAWDWPLTWLTNHRPSVLWHSWLGHLTHKISLGDRAFAVVGARVWNSLPATLTSQLSLLMFRRQLKTLLFEQSFSWLFFSSSVLLDTTFSRLLFFVTVTCPCSSMTKCHVNLFVYNNNNNNNNNKSSPKWLRMRRVGR